MDDARHSMHMVSPPPTPARLAVVATTHVAAPPRTAIGTLPLGFLMEMEVLMNQLIAKIVEIDDGSLEVDQSDVERELAGCLAAHCDFGNAFEEGVTAGVKAAYE